MKKYIKGNLDAPMLMLLILFFVGSLARLLWLDEIPMGLHQDEAYSAYNSWAVMKYGIDSYGYTRPVYYTVWGSGMSVLYSYFTMPFFALFGVHTWTIRLPQAILGSLSILVMYGLGQELFRSRWMSVFFAGLLAVNPWHIQQSRVGLDCNLAVPMLLTAVYFLCRYLNGKSKSMWGAAFFFGLTLYSYALTWILVPALLFLSFLFFWDKLKFDRNFWLPLGLLFLMACPLLVFLAVNFDWIEEIRNSFFSIPKLPQLRTGELGLHGWQIKKRFLDLMRMLLRQHDDRWWISNETVGSYYYISTPFILLGILYHIRVFIKGIISRMKFALHFILALWFGVSVALGSMLDQVYFHKVNYIHIPIIMYTGIGIWCLGKFLKHEKGMAWMACGTYACCFGYFVYTQLTFPVNYEAYGQPGLSHMNWYQYEEALGLADELTDGPVAVLGLNYANVMLYEQIPPQEYQSTVVYEEEGQAFGNVCSIGRYHFDIYPGAETEWTVFVYPYSMESFFLEQGYHTVYADKCYGVAWRE